MLVQCAILSNTYLHFLLGTNQVVLVVVQFQDPYHIIEEPMYHSIKSQASSTKLDVSPFIFVYREGLLWVAWGICCRCMDCIVYLSNVKCILMQWPKGNKEYKPPLRENRSFLLIYVQRVLEASSLRVYGFLMRHSLEFIHLFLELHGTKLF